MGSNRMRLQEAFRIHVSGYYLRIARDNFNVYIEQYPSTMCRAVLSFVDQHI